MNEKVLKALNDQVNMEFYSAYLYNAMAGYMQSVNLPGFCRWLEVQAMEEVYHAFKIYRFIIDRRSRTMLLPLEGPANEWASPLAAFEAAFAHEQKVTASINNIVDLATKEKELSTVAFLQWYVTEQVEEEANVDAVVQNLKMAAGAGQAMMMLDRELAARAFVIPPEMAAYVGAGGGAV
jgi:ferritin